MYNPFRRTYSSQELAQFKFLTKTPLFSKLSNDELSYFLPFLYPREYKQDEVIFFRGDPSQALYIVRSGIIGLSIDVAERIEPLSQRKANQSLGENALIENSKRLHNAVVQSEKVELVVIPQANLLEVFRQKDSIKAKMYEALALHFNAFLNDMFYAYRTNEGFFELSQAFSRRNV
jgi:CRP/FNR family transcriptional regulator, cyclic AMP receptor protein